MTDAICCTIGKFEAIHRGHQTLLAKVVNHACQQNLTPAVILFDPHPYKILHDPAYKPLFIPRERDNLLKTHGIKKIITLSFDQNLQNLTAEQFCQKLASLANISQIVVGENFKYGKNREGTIDDLQKEFKVKTVGLCPTPHKPLKLARQSRASLDPNFDVLCTSDIRAMLEQNRLPDASEMLGFPFFIEGVVTKGRQLGRVLGFPTVNIYPPEEKFLPTLGVYETRTTIDGKHMQSLTNVGYRPTIETEKTAVSVETHIPALIAKPDEMYGKQIKVEFIRFIREERRFGSTEELQEQIKNDIKEI